MVAARALATLLRAALPQACTLCVALSGDALVCDACAAGMPRVVAACPRCALPSPAGQVCGACLVAPPPQASTIAAWRYEFPADRLLQAFKYRAALALAEADLGRTMQQTGWTALAGECVADVVRARQQGDAHLPGVTSLWPTVTGEWAAGGTTPAA